MKMNTLKSAVVVCFTIGIIMTQSSCTGTKSTQEAKIEEITQRLNTLEKEVKVARDIEEIKQLHIRYIDNFTKVKMAEVANCFSKDAVLEVFQSVEPFVGIEDITKVFALRKTPDRGTILVNPLISVDGDHAKGSWCIYFIEGEANKSLRITQGYYDAEYIRENGQWKISYLKWGTEGGMGFGVGESTTTKKRGVPTIERSRQSDPSANIGE